MHPRTICIGTSWMFVFDTSYFVTGGRFGARSSDHGGVSLMTSAATRLTSSVIGRQRNTSTSA